MKYLLQNKISVHIINNYALVNYTCVYIVVYDYHVFANLKKIVHKIAIFVLYKAIDASVGLITLYGSLPNL